MAIPGDAGVYIVGTGNTGAGGTVLSVGIVYFIIMIIAAFQYRVPAEGWLPEGYKPPSKDESASKMKTLNNAAHKYNIQESKDYSILNDPSFKAKEIEGAPATKKDIDSYYAGTYVGANGGRVGFASGGYIDPYPPEVIKEIEYLI